MCSIRRLILRKFALHRNPLRLETILHHLAILSRRRFLHAPPRLAFTIEKWRVPILQAGRNICKLDTTNGERRILALWARHRVALTWHQKVLHLLGDKEEMHKTATISEATLDGG
jgi:hypothetical protein